MELQPITEPVYLRFGQDEHHIGDLEIPCSVTASAASPSAMITVDTDSVPAHMAALLRAAADRIESGGTPDAAAG
jgi:hypothetical protein